MKLALWAGVGAIWAVALGWSGSEPDRPLVVLVGGDTDGYLSPCGCVKPMSGGIRRRASAIGELAPTERALIVDNGALIAGIGRQDEIKAETMAESLRALGVDAVNLGPQEAAVGAGLVLSIHRLSGNKFVATAMEPSETNPVPRWIEADGALVGGVPAIPASVAIPLGERAIPLDRAIDDLVQEASIAGLHPVLLLQGDRLLAERIASDHPGLRLIVYRSTGKPPEEPVRVGQTLLITPGDKGKQIVRAELGAQDAYAVVDLGPQFSDDPSVSRIYAAYQRRVADERLLDRLPRSPSDPFIGSRACGSCHAEAYAVWEKSEHASALKTLEDDGHDRDPDCTGCHVVGLDREGGFTSRSRTPELADVGCESCHGPGRKHALDPQNNPMVRLGPGSCGSCHNADHSPTFDWETYWAKIAH